jgi:hypothetical protein
MPKEKNMPSGPSPPGEPSPPDANKRANLTTNPVIDRLKPQPYDQRYFTELVGYIGTVDTKAGTVQVYPQLDLRTYFLVPIKAIAFAEPVNANQQSSPTKLVIEATAKIEVFKSYQRSHEAGFLCGAIAAANLKSAKADTSAAAGSPSEVAATGMACPSPGVSFGIGGTVPPSKCAKPCMTDPIYVFDWER